MKKNIGSRKCGYRPYALEKPFNLISEIIGGEDPKTFLDGPICHGGFSRLN